MQRPLSHIALAGRLGRPLLVALTLLTFLGGSIARAPHAHACSMVEPMPLTLELLRASSPEDIADPDGPIGQAWNEFHAGYGDPAVVVSVERIRTVIRVEPAEDQYASPGGVTVTDAAWGAAGDRGPQVEGLDNSTCYFAPPRLDQTRWIVTTDSWAAIDIWSDGAIAEIELELTRLFGEPVRPDRDADAEAQALDRLLDRADAVVGGQLQPIERIDIDTGVIATVESSSGPAADSGASDSDAAAWAITAAGVGVVVAIAAVLRTVLKNRS